MPARFSTSTPAPPLALIGTSTENFGAAHPNEGVSATAVNPALVSMPGLPTPHALQPFVFRTFGRDFLMGKRGVFFWICSKNQSKASQSCEKAAGCSWRQVLIVGKRRR